MNAALGLDGSVLVDKILESSRSLAAVSEPNLRINFLSGMNITERREADVMKRVIRNIVFAEVRPAVFEGPEGQWIQLLTED